MFEQNLQNSLFSGQSEKTYIDKMLARKEVDEIRELIKKPKLKREELLEVLYLISGTESKLFNFGEWDRYVILKFFVWIREFIKIAELLYDSQDELDKKENTCSKCQKLIKTDQEDKCNCQYPKPQTSLSKRTRRLFDNNERLIEHNAKFLIDLYLNIGRTSLSIGATGLLELLKNKYEVVYPAQQGTQLQENKAGVFMSKR